MLVKLAPRGLTADRPAFGLAKSTIDGDGWFMPQFVAGEFSPVIEDVGELVKEICTDDLIR